MLNDCRMSELVVVSSKYVAVLAEVVPRLAALVVCRGNRSDIVRTATRDVLQ